MNENLIITSVDELKPMFRKNYREFIAEKPRTVIFEEEEFTLYNFEKMMKRTNIDGMEVSHIYALHPYVKTLSEFMNPSFKDLDGYKWSLEKLALGKAIGANSEGDLLFFGCYDNTKVHVFRHDDGSIKRTKLTLFEIIKQFSE
ncbi:hypothetical protein [uncultured Formosa sp.]|uniref:hypothetical protein n=1 Tax=uncultured Formosa sp. TaxID=255435 RepID=UPI00262CCD11|nr:hypothetical protein [uncultured Formosa sp.]